MTGPIIEPLALMPQMMEDRLAEIADMGIPLSTADWALHVQSGRWVNRLVYNADRQLSRDAEIVATSLRV